MYSIMFEIILYFVQRTRLYFSVLSCRRSTSTCDSITVVSLVGPVVVVCSGPIPNLVHFPKIVLTCQVPYLTKDKSIELLAAKKTCNKHLFLMSSLFSCFLTSECTRTSS